MSKRTLATLVTISTLAALAAITSATATGAYARAPSAVTGAASQVSYASAVLSGAVYPRGVDTTYYFEYGPTRAYGLTTVVSSAGAGLAKVAVSAPISGLAPVTRYHFRLVALNSAGATVGGDRSFKTAPVPLSLAILGAPNPTLFGQPAVIEGTLSGTGNANRPVVLQENPFPFTQGFVDLGEPHLTTAAGGFAFPVLGLTETTEFRVATVTKSPIVSPVVIEGVAVSVTIEARRTRRRHRVRIFGAVTPNVEGMPVEILKLVGGRAIPVASTVTRGLSASSAHYSKVIRARRHGGVYEVLVRVSNGAQTSAYSAPIRIR
jgi:hypothetical protein